MKFNFLLKFRCIFVVGVFFLLIYSVFFLIAGAVECTHGYIESIKFGFQFRPILILALSVALFFVKSEGFGSNVDKIHYWYAV